MLLTPSVGSAASPNVLRVGHFPNVTHAQGLVGHHHSRVGNGWFETRLGNGVKVEWYVFNAGPGCMEALLAGSLDLTYVGPNPAINAHLRSGGREVRIVAGACSGGAALVVQPDGRIRADADFKGKKIATPQLGNTQDVAARAYLRSKGLRITLAGGDAHVIPTSNPDQLVLFQKGDIDAVWTVEPWVTRMVLQGHGRILFEEATLWPETQGKYVTTHLVASVRLIAERPALLDLWVDAHVELTEWIRANIESATKIMNQEIMAETTRALPDEIIDGAMKRIEITWDPVSPSLVRSARDAHEIGFIKMKPDLQRIYSLESLNKALRKRSLPEIR